MNSFIYDVCIIGCGPVGLTLANCLSKSPYISKIALVDPSIPLKNHKQLDQNQVPNQRVYSINNNSLNLLQRIGILNRINLMGTMKCIQVISKQSKSFVKWSPTPVHVIENNKLIEAMINNITSIEQGLRKVQFIQNQIASIENNNYQSNDYCNVKFKQNNINLKCKLLVGSDGRNSTVKQLSNLYTYGWNYRQRSIVCTLKIDKDAINNNQAYQIYHDGNILALLPLWDQYVNLIWSVNYPQFQYLMQLNSQEFIKQINCVIGNSNQNIKHPQYHKISNILSIINDRLSFPLHNLQCSNYTAKRIALVGDAAHTIHPMAGLGVNSGIMDSALLANNIIRNVKTGNDIGQPIALSSYETKSKSYNYGNSIALQFTKKFFEINNPILSVGRNLGMSFLQNSSYLKDNMAKVVDYSSLKEHLWEQQI